MAWTRICRIDELPVQGARVLECTPRVGGNVAVFRTATDAVFALHDRCPHKGGPLSQGIVHGERVACPLHGWNIELDSGCAVAPDEGYAQRFPVKLEAGVVYLELPAPTALTANRVRDGAAETDESPAVANG
jgi:nitrite reductase (NADH) small subunit